MDGSESNSARPAPAVEDPGANVLIDLYRRMVLLRRFETAAQIACRKGETPGFLHLYIGQEATAVGICSLLTDADWVTSTHRGHGHALAKGMAPNMLMAELFGRSGGCCGGRGGTMHLYDRSIGLFGTNGIVAAGISHAVGVALSARTRGTPDVSVAFFGDGATNHGGFHEGLNLAAVLHAPVVFVCENNLYATATPLASATLNTDIASKAASYGIPGVAVDGNDVMAVRAAMTAALARAHAGQGPTLIEAKTYRTVGHHEGDPVTGTYRSQGEVDAWAKRDPIERFRQKLIAELGVASDAALAAIDTEIDVIVQEALTYARSSPPPDPATVARHVFADPINPPEALRQAGAGEGKVTGWLDAVRDGIAEEMRHDPAIVYLGEGIGERAGTFAHTKGLWKEFGAGRVIDTPISEQAFTGASVGSSATGSRAIADLMFADFLFEAAGQIVLQASKLRYMSNGQMNAPMVVRVGAGALRSAGPHHSGTYHAAWGHIPGLIVCMPSTPADAKGLMKTALRAGDPVLMLEPKALFSSKGPVPEGEHFVPFGVARIVRTGRDITIASVGQLVHQALEAAEKLSAEGIEAEVIDMRTIVPLDVHSVARSVAKTNRLLVVDEGYGIFGLGAELGQAMSELAFDDLDAPVGRLHTLPQTHPFAPVLEAAMLVDPAKIVAAAKDVIGGRAPISDHWRASAAPTEAVAPVVAKVSPAPQSQPAAAVAAAKPGVESGEPILMPFGDLTVTEGKIVAWRKAEGDTVKAGELVAEVETDKAVVEIESPAAGIIAAIEHPVGTVVAMGARLGLVRPA
ncbi:MAG: thiamine pyrophosphate-dependent enzyme [Bauldia sp.]